MIASQQRSHASDVSPASSRAWQWGIAALLLLAVVVAYWPVVHNGWVIWDDEKNFLDNFHYRGLGTQQLAWAWTTFLLGVYQPFAWILLEIQYVIWTLNPHGYHFTSLLLHAANAVALYLLTARLLIRFASHEGERNARTIHLSAGIATFLFAVHPLRAEVVAWVSCQPYLPCALFYLLGVWAYLEAFPPDAPPRRGWWGTSFLLFVAALLCKAPAVTFPAILVLLDWFPLRRIGAGPGGWLGPGARKVWLEKVPFFAMGFVFMVLAVAAKRHAPTLTAMQVQPGGVGTPQLAQASYGIWFYLIKTIWPTGIMAYYAVPAEVQWWIKPTFMISMVGAFAGTLALLWNAWRWPAVFVAWMSYLAMLAPNLGLITISKQITADRYCYVAMMPLTIVLAAGIVKALAGAPWLRRWRLALAPVAAGAGVLLGVLAWNQTLTWRTSEALWRQAIKYDASNSEIRVFLGLALVHAGNVEEGEHYFREAIRLAPGAAEAHNDLGTALAQRGNLDEAEVQFRETLRIRPQHVEAHNNLGTIYVKQGEFALAIGEYSKSLEFDPENLVAFRNLDYLVSNAKGLEEDQRRRAEAILGAHHDLASRVMSK